MKNKATFTGTLKAAASENHPAKQLLSFVFTDYKPNRNKQGVPREEAQNIIATAEHMPVKMNFSSRKPKGHLGAIPIGPIVSLREEEDRIVGEAVVWKDEMPDVASYLEKASAETGGVQFSWELYYANSNIDADGVQWLRDIVTAGITVVDTPAYQGRTPLLAIAEEQFMDELQKKIEELTTQVANLTSAVAEKDQKIADLEKSVAEMTGAKETLEKEVSELRDFKATAEKEKADAEILSGRKQQMAEAGLDMGEETFNKRKDMFLAMSDEAFKAYVDDLVAVGKSEKKAEASDKRIVIPDPVTNSGGTSGVSIKDMAKALRANRG